jgi:2-dehydropantoate 2-reductase
MDYLLRGKVGIGRRTRKRRRRQPAKGSVVRVAIAGAGGVGGLLAGLLARAGTEVSLLARGEHLSAIRENGIRVETPEGAFTARVQASDSAADLPPASALIVAVKTWQLPAASSGLGALLEPSGIALPLLNGVEAADVLAATLGKERVCGGLCHVFAWIEAPGVIKTATPLRVTVGELFGHGGKRLEELCAALRTAGAHASVSADIRSALWEKLLFVGPLGAVGAAARVTAGRLRSISETRALLERAMREVQAVARASGASIDDAAVSTAMERVDSLPPEGTTSMHRDLLAGKRSELDDLVGAVVRAAAPRQVPVPVHEALYALLLPHELAARAQ